MPALGTAYVNVKAALKPLKTGLSRAHDSVKKSVSAMQRTLDKLTFNNPLIAAAGMGGTAYGLGQIASSAIDVASSFEQMERKLDVLTNGQGPETLDRLNAWAMEMPVNTREAVDAFVMMQAMGLDPTIDKMQTLVDVSSIFGGETMHRVARALGQMQTNGKLLGEELNQLAESGINARKILIDHFGMTIEQLQKSGTDINEIIEAIWQGLDANYAGAAQSAMNSWQGLVAIFESNLMEITRQVMDAGLFEYLKQNLGEVNRHMRAWIDANQDFIRHELPEHIKEITAGLAELAKIFGWITHKFLIGVVALKDMAKVAKDFGIDKYNQITGAPERHKITDTRKSDSSWSEWISETDIEIPLDIEKFVTDLDFASAEARKWRAKLIDTLHLPLDIDMGSLEKKKKTVLSSGDGGQIAQEYQRFLDELSRIGTGKDPYQSISQAVDDLESKEIPRVLKIQEEINQARVEAAQLVKFGEGELYQSQIAQLDELERRLQSSDAWEEMIEEQNQASKDMKALAESTASSMESAFSDIFFDGMTGQFKKLEDYVKNLLQSLSRMIANFAAQKMVQGLFNLGGGPPLLPSTGGSVALANGGIIDEHIVGYGLKSGTRYELGESGPEAVLPMSRMKKGGGGSSHSVKINIMNNSGQPIEQKSISQEIRGQEIIISAVIDGIERNVNGIRDYLR